MCQWGKSKKVKLFKNPGEIIIEDKDKNKIFISIKEGKKLCNKDK